MAIKGVWDKDTKYKERFAIVDDEGGVVGLVYLKKGDKREKAEIEFLRKGDPDFLSYQKKLEKGE